MAIKYFYAVHEISTATERNANFAGEVHAYIKGKENFTLFCETPDGWHNCNLLAPYWVKKYGYTRECDAKRNYTFNHPQNDKYWKTEVRIVRLLVKHDNSVVIC